MKPKTTDTTDNRPLLPSLDGDRRTIKHDVSDYDSLTVTQARATIAEGQRDARTRRRQREDDAQRR